MVRDFLGYSGGQIPMEENQGSDKTDGDSVNNMTGKILNWKEYHKHPEKYWVGKKVITLIDMQSGQYTIPKGTILEIERKYKGFNLMGLEICPHCKIGLKISIWRVEPHHLMVAL
jgi:hypothetical protein